MIDGLELNSITVHSETNVAKVFQKFRFIDVTAVGTDLLEFVSCWHLHTYDSLSDHKAIEIDIALNSNSPRKDGDSCVFNLRKTNNSSKYLLSRISDRIVSCKNPESLDDLANELISIIQKSSKMPIPIKKQEMHRVLWWTTEIVCMRKHDNTARRRFQKFKQQFQVRFELSGITFPSGTATKYFEETINEVDSHSFLDYCENDDDDCRKEIRNDALIINNVTNDLSFTINEIDDVINKLELKKTPDPDSERKKLHEIHELHESSDLRICMKCMNLLT
ncbi:hypothetical protein TNCV_4365111 [Trichonephila clavipes]|nr:hypothetical protein TNCV_4365111 [Trichonephila clavipes]